MGIYRGPGGTGDAVTDASSEASIVAALVVEATAAKNAAEAAQTAAQTAETNAETAETNAETAQAAAELAETHAETAEANAETAQAAAEAARDASINMAENFDVTASTLSAGSSATASYNNDTFVLALGIPRGDTGATGATGPTGATGATGPTGNGIDTVVRTSGNGDPGTTDTYTITYTDATTDTFTVYNGANGTGAVSSVTATSPLTSSGGNSPNIALSAGYGDTTNPYTSKTANYVLAAPNGTAGVPSFRALVAADVPTLNQNTTGTAANVTGTVAIANGGTGQTAKAAAFNALSPVTSTGDLIIGNGSNSNTRLAIGTSGYLLTSDGTTASWAAAPVSLPTQTGNSGKFLKTDGTEASWSALPTVLPVLNRAGSSVSVSVGNGLLPVLNRAGSTVNVAVT